MHMIASFTPSIHALCKIKVFDGFLKNAKGKLEGYDENLTLHTLRSNVVNTPL